MNRRTFAGRVLGALAAALALPWRTAGPQPNVAFGTPEHGAATRANTVEFGGIAGDNLAPWVKWEYIRRTFDERGEGFMYGRFSDNRYIGPCRIERLDGSVEYMP